ncbi:MAG TPA: glycerol-3-phosphate dehydrogenase/oxidase [Pirellulales bacterium]|jgi:glycerol-3-phosphate dehydrogenase|nr:glycerol-3-phosphate dehydrogenase/oxidase [Pirellulales bacterium]
MADQRQSVLILGGGINGAAIARELAINGVPVTLVESADLAFGATAYSSRLIHGGLRYLEYGEFDLVRESLAERTRLLKLAPQYVRPLELFIPVENRFGGLAHSVSRFARLERWFGGAHRSRGLWLVEAGLWLYDRYARDPSLPRHRAWRRDSQRVPPVDERRYRWLCSYFDAQIRFPERFVMALLADAGAAAAQHGSALEVWTYHQARLRGKAVEIIDTQTGAAAREWEPSAIINATGAWVDRTLQRLGIASRQLMAGTKGSHLVTYHEPLRQALAGRGLYAEATDGRPVFLLPFGSASLIGTTDLPYSGDPADAVTSPAEVAYLVGTANGLFPRLGLSAENVELHYCGVRPLPATSSSSTAGITRRHWVEEHPGAPVPMFSVIGGKLTTCRSLAESTTDTLLQRLGRQRIADSRQRLIPGAEGYPRDEEERDLRSAALERAYGLGPETLQQMWTLLGTRAEAVLKELGQAVQPDRLLAGTHLPASLAAWSIRHEHVRRLDDLVERRLMLLYHRNLPRACLDQLADLLIAQNCLPATDRQRAVDDCQRRLQTHFGKTLT